MPQTINSAERWSIRDKDFEHFAQLEIRDPDGAWRDVSTSLNGIDWLTSTTLTESIDGNCLQLQATLAREAGSLSFAPLMTGSLVNRNLAAAYAPMLDLHRQWRFSSAVLPFGFTPAKQGGVVGTWSSSGVTLAGTAAQINDGNLSTNAFHTDTAVPGAYAQVDLGAGVAHTYDTVSIWEASTSSPAIWKVRGSIDGTTWVDLITGWQPNGQASKVSLSFPASAYRFWRLELTNTPGPGSWINEVQFSGSSRINKCPWSEQLNQWAPRGPSTSSQNLLTAPDGNPSADRFEPNGAGGYIVRSIETSDPNGRTFTVSVWLRSLSGTKSINYGLLSNTDVGIGPQTTVTISTTWQRFFITRTANVSCPSYGFYVQDNDGAGFSNFGVWGADVKESSILSPYISNGTGGPVTVNDWKQIGLGYIDRIDDGGIPNTLSINGRCLGARLLDAQIPVNTRIYSPGGVTSMEAVVQAMLDDQFGGGVITLYTPTSSGIVIRPFVQGFANFQDAVNAVVQQFGWVCRYRMDSTGVYRYTLYLPVRNATVVDWIMDPTEYTDIPLSQINIDGVRNGIELRYIRSSDGSLQTVRSPTTFTSASITAYDLRYMGVDMQNGTQINDNTSAQGMADAIRTDLELPALVQKVVVPGFWPVQLHDYLQFNSNGVMYDSAQNGAVTAYTLTWENGRLTATLDCSAKPKGKYTTWRDLGSIDKGQPANLRVDVTPGSPNYTLNWTGDNVQYTTNGGVTYAAPPASPFTIARNVAGGADQVVTFRGRLGAQIVSNSVTIPALSGSTPPALAIGCSLTNNQTDDTVSPASITAVGVNLPAAYTWIVQQGFAAGQYTTTIASGSNSSNPIGGAGFSFNVTPNMKLAKSLRLTLTVGSDTYIAYAEVLPRIPLLRASDGAPFRNVPYDDGNYGHISTTSNGLTLHGSSVDTRGSAVNTHYRLPVDTLDGVTDGATYGKPILTRLSGGKPLIDFSEAIHINKNGGFIAQSASNATVLSAITGHLDNSGNAASAFTDSRSSAVNTHYRLPVDTIDGVSDGATYSRPLATRVSSGKPLIDFSEAIHFNKNLTNIADTATRFASPVPDAMSGPRFLASANVTLGGSNAAKNSSPTVWDGQVYSIDGFTGGAHASASATAGQDYTMFGLNTDPATDANYTSIDYAVYIQLGGAIEIYQSGVAQGSGGTTWAGGDVFAVVYDGSTIRYMKNGTVFGTSVYVGPGIKFFFDSSFYNQGATTSQLKNIQFGPMTGGLFNASNQIVRGVIYNDSAYAVKAGSSDGRQIAGLDVYDVTSGQYISNAFYRSAHNLDNVVDGGTYLRVAGINGSNKVTPSSTIGRGTYQAYNAGGQTLTTGTTPVQLTLDTAQFTLGTGVTRSGNQLIINDSIATNGTWVCVAQVGFAANATGDRHVEIRKNGTVIGQATIKAATAATFVPPVVAFSQVALSDAFDVYVWENSGGNLAIVVGGGATYFTMTHLW